MNLFQEAALFPKLNFSALLMENEGERIQSRKEINSLKERSLLKILSPHHYLKQPEHKLTTLAQSINQARRMLKCSQEQEKLAIIRRILLEAEL